MYTTNSDPQQPNNKPKSKPWFGSKRYGFGIRPQTWHGWLIVALIVAAFYIVQYVTKR